MYIGVFIVLSSKKFINMDTAYKLLDAVSLQNNINVNCALSVSADNRYCIVAEDGLYILHLCGMMDTISPTISLKKLFILIPEYSPSSNLEIDINLFLSELPQNELYETILNLDLSEKVRDVANLKQQPVQVKWSPLGLVSNGHCAIASITNRGSLNIFVCTVNEVEFEEYVSIANITKCYIDHLRPSWSTICGNPSLQLEGLKHRVHEVLPTAFEWSTMIKVDDTHFCCLFVGHLNGDISTWKFDCRKMNDIDCSGITLISTHKTDMKRITALSWQQLGSNGLLLVGDLEGRVKLIPITNISEQRLTFGEDVYLWNELDQIQIEYFKNFFKDGMTFFVIVKGSFLLICLINRSGNILDMHNFHVGNLQVSGIEQMEDNKLVILTHNGVIKELKLIVENDKLQIDWRYVYVDFPWHLYQTHGIIISSNRVFTAILVSMAKINDIRRKKAHTKLLIFKNNSKNPLQILMKNSSESLMSFWDCLEILRLNGVIEKKLSCDGLPSGLNYDKLSVIQLKTCLWLAKSSEVLYDKMYLKEEYNLLRSDELKFILKIKLACKHMHHLFERIAEGKELDEFHMQSLDIINMYLKEIVVDDVIPNLGLGKNTIAELYDAISAANELQYPAAPKCMLCNEDIIGTSCVPPHMDTRCSISLMQVADLPYYKCPFCASIVHWRLTDIYSYIVCPFCDVAMDLVSDIHNTSHSGKQIIISSCNIDCEKESIEITDIEEHAFVAIEQQGESIDLIAVSSSDEEEASNNEDSTSENITHIEILSDDETFRKNLKNE